MIPKIPQPTNLSNFRPISLCNVLYKIIAKMVATRFKDVFSVCINEAQSTFVPNKLISDNVLLAYGILHTFNHKRVGNMGFMALKLYMNKAYDRVD